MAADSPEGCEVQTVMNEVDRNNFSKVLDRKSGGSCKINEHLPFQSCFRESRDQGKPQLKDSFPRVRESCISSAPIDFR